MKIETLKIKSKVSRRYGVCILFSNRKFFIEFGFGKLVFMIGVF